MKIICLIIALFVANVTLATVRVYMYTTPDTFRFAGSNTPDHFIDVNNDGLNDIKLTYIGVPGLDTFLSATTVTANGWSMEVSANGNDSSAIAYNCGAQMGLGSAWANGANLLLFYGNGPRYIATRKSTGTSFWYFGWVKMEISADGLQCIIYGTAYEDLNSQGPTITTGNGECNHDAIDEQELPGFSIFAYNNHLQVNGPEPANIRVYNVLGKQLSSYQFEGGSSTYDLQNIGSGCYFVEAVSGTRRKTVKVIL